MTQQAGSSDDETTPQIHLQFRRVPIPENETAVWEHEWMDGVMDEMRMM